MMETEVLRGKCVIITGAASERGIGRAVSRIFAQAGARIIVLDLDEAAARQAAQSLGQGHLGFGCNVTNNELCQSAVARGLAEVGRIDCLINVAGISQAGGITDVSQADLTQVIDVNLKGSFNMTQAVVPAFREQRAGNIICIGSLAAQRGGGLFGGPHYAASKGAVHSLVKSLARELGAFGIRANAVAPGLVNTDIFQDKLSASAKEDIALQVPLRRLALPDDVANACLFLASEMSAYVTGIVLDVNGGLHIH